MEKKNKVTGLFLVCVTEFLMMRISLVISRYIVKYLLGPGTSETAITFVMLVLFIIPIAICLIYMKITYPSRLRLFINGGFKKSAVSLGIGLAIGFAMNVTLCISAFASGSLECRFVGLSPLLIAVFIPCFIQCASEEVLIRGYATSYLEEKYPADVVAFTGGVLFVLHHIGNLSAYGFNSIFCLNTFIIGIVLYLAMKVTGSIWTAFGIHTAWNYTQEFMFGSENSGITSPFCLFASLNGKDSFFCNTVYGNEGTYMCTVLLIIVTILLYKLYFRAKPSD